MAKGPYFLKKCGKVKAEEEVGFLDLFQTIGRGMEKAFDRVKDTSQRAKYSAKMYSNRSKLKIQKMEVEEQINRLYQDLGQAYYDYVEVKTEENQEKIREVMVKIDEQKEILKAIENQIRLHKFKEEAEEVEKRCPCCNEPIEDKDQYCSHCGQSIEETKVFERGIFVDNVEILTKMCPNCGNQLSVHAKYCNRCGLNMEKY